MFKVTLNIFVILFIHENIGYLVKVNRKYLKSDFDNVIKKYIGPMKKIKAEFPNHAVELQLEIHETVTEPSAVYLRHPSVQRRSMPGRSKNRRELKKVESSSVTVISTTTPETTKTTQITPVITTTTPVTSKNMDPDPSKKPVSMGDLMKALDEFAIKHFKNIQYTNDSLTPVKLQETSKTHGELRHIDDILKLIKKGVQIKKHVPKPNEDGLDWLQIKIPKTL